MKTVNSNGFITWTDSEWMDVARAFRAFRTRDSGNFASTGAMAIAAMEVLPKERRRPNSCNYEIARKLRTVYLPRLAQDGETKGSVTNTATAVAAIVKDHISPAEKFAADLKSVPSLDLSEPMTLQSKTAPTFNRRASDTSFEGSLLNSITSLAGVIAQRFEEELLAQLHVASEHAMASVDDRFKQRLAEARRAVKAPKIDLPKVMIVGLQGSQPNDIVDEYGEVLDLRFIEATSSTSLLKAGAKHSDFVVLVTKFISHHHQEAVREHPGLIYCNGVVSELKDILLPLACR